MSYSSCPPQSSASFTLTMIERPRRRGFSVSGAKQALVLSEGEEEERKRRRGRAKGHDAFNEMSFLGHLD
ncbi:hypothetical protein DY000_02057017 [Brassica cretica]|uniref:Uncharacterized protein n=1 Tax=Brassica cretica TaxID=69181 RepID=A0ABQ7AAW3_BRACR|nr:hypothetical protein DY000_02057017 [Brassica cretica]